MKKIFVAEALGELVCCSKSIKKCFNALKHIQPELPSYSRVTKNIKEDDAWGFDLSEGYNYSIRKTNLI